MFYTDKKTLYGWYFNKAFCLLLISVGIDDLAGDASHDVFRGHDFFICIIGMAGFIKSMVTPMAMIKDDMIYIYKGPLSFITVKFLLSDALDIELKKGRFVWRINIKLASGEIISYPPSPLETDMERIVNFLKPHLKKRMDCVL